MYLIASFGLARRFLLCMSVAFAAVSSALGFSLAGEVQVGLAAEGQCSEIELECEPTMLACTSNAYLRRGELRMWHDLPKLLVRRVPSLKPEMCSA
jgi:hypothetical protein